MSAQNEIADLNLTVVALKAEVARIKYERDSFLELLSIQASRMALEMRAWEMTLRQYGVDVEKP